jgi:exopolysaccharide biosynthesis protein
MTTLEVNGFNLELSDNIVIPLTYSVADIKDPSKRKQGYSKSIDIIGTTSNMAFFRSAWSLTISDVDGSGLRY